MAKIQKIVMFYRRSPVKNDVLQELITDERGRQLKLQKDCKTRWSSIVTMFRNFLKTRGPIYDDLSQRGKEHMFPTQSEIDHIKSVTEALKIIAFATAKLGAHDMNLAKADQIFEFAFIQLDQLTSEISTDLRMSMYRRIEERRLEDVTTLLAYLKNPRFLNNKPSKLSYSTKAGITEMAISVYTRLFENDLPTTTETINEEGA